MSRKTTNIQDLMSYLHAADFNLDVSEFIDVL